MKPTLSKKMKTKSNQPVDGESLQKKVEKLEQKLKKMEKVIEKWDRKEVDMNFDLDSQAEINTPYLVKSRTVDRYMRFWKILCEIQKHNPVNTGRPIHKTIAAENVTRFPEIDEAFFKNVNSHIRKDVYYFPDFPEVLSIVENVKEDKNLPIRDSDIRQIAKDLFERIAVVLKKRRRKDFCVVLPAEEIKDPAEEDTELYRKLEENKSKGKREADVIREFVEKQTEEIDLGDEDSSDVSEDEEDVMSNDEEDAMNNNNEVDEEMNNDDEMSDNEADVLQNHNENAMDNDNEISNDSDVLILSDEEASQSSVIEIFSDNEDDSDIEILAVTSGCA